MQVNGYDVIVGDEWVCKNGKKVIIQEIHSNVKWCILGDSISFNKDGIYSITEQAGPYDLNYPAKTVVCDEEPNTYYEEYVCEPDTCDEEYVCEPSITYYEEPTEDEIEVFINTDVSKREQIEVTRFIKYDNGKPAFDLVDPFFEEDIAKVLSMGAAKYEANNWQLNDDITRYIGALQRHLNDIKKGVYKDKESKLQHTAHIACNAMFIHWMIRNGKVSK